MGEQMPDAGGRGRRLALLSAPYVAALVALAVFSVSRYDRLPDPMATHFGPGGGADGYLARPVALWVPVAFVVGMWLLFAWIPLRSGPGPGRRPMLALGAGVGAMLGYVFVVTVLVNTDVADAAEVALPIWHLAVSFGIAALVGLVVWRLAGPDPEPEADPAVPAPRLDLAEGEAASWSRRTGSPLLGGVAVAAVVAALVLGVVGVRAAVVPLLVAAAVTGALTGIRVTVDRHGLTVGHPLVRQPRKRVPLERIEAARTRRISALAEFGGWGYRIRPGASGLVLRSGEGLSVMLANGKEFVVTVEDSATAAALLNTLVERARRAAG
ncbi:DUF1648 domain-containing protein [Streptomyces sodiiphilus]|uniref:DUF1648 domain-containing protein n=1 Tax=Streptomyces sodiiphilus TaxID=226217 RepID=A0ABN2P328_9ACTN